MVLKLPRLTLFGRSLLLVTCEILANVVCWTVAAWTLGLRHALDADHISAIDNATRSLINLQQLHTIVIVVSLLLFFGVYEKINGVGDVGGIIGAAVSGSFLFIIALANSIILFKILKHRREIREQRRATGEIETITERRPEENHMIMMRILGPIITFVNRPWKVRTTSQYLALAKKGSTGSSIPSSHIVILPLLFTSGMTLIDSADSILMLYSYSGFPERGFRIFSTGDKKEITDPEKNDFGLQEVPQLPSSVDEDNRSMDRDMRLKINAMSGLSILLTLMSILVAFSISLITIMSLIGDQCSPCSAAAEADNGHGGGLAGHWWRAWATASDQSGYIGIAIVGVFSLIVVSWYGGKWVAKKVKDRRIKC
ncbi:NicO-domain-containing protein [Pholiota molesta]|nr:NicO-domain-containing protein [Pholiota molesta]